MKCAPPAKCDGVVISDGNRIHADLGVDAAGVSSRVPEYLAAVGVVPPEETIVDAFVGYAGIWGATVEYPNSLSRPHLDLQIPARSEYLTSELGSSTGLQFCGRQCIELTLS